MYNFIIITLFTTYLIAVDYETEIQPIWNSNCGGCHLSNSSGGLNLSSYANLMSNNVIVPGDHNASELYDRITRDNSASGDMPPNNAELSQLQIDLIATWIDEGALEEEVVDITGCMDINAITCEDEIDSLYFPECHTCSEGVPCDNYYNSEATVDNDLCMYNVVPSNDEFIITQTISGFNLDWSLFIPPVEIQQFTLQRCADIDGDCGLDGDCDTIDGDGTQGDGILEYETCAMVIPPMSFYLNTNVFDEYTLEGDASLKYTFYVDYPNNNYWGSAHGYYFYDNSSLLMGDINFDGILNVLDIVTMVNAIIGDIQLSSEQELASDFNGDGIINVIDIVSLVNIIIS